MARRIGAYVLVQTLGRGAMGEVHLARKDGADETCALKLVFAGADEGLRKRFLREARLLASLDHPNLVRLLDFGEADGELYYAMEAVRGRTLREIFEARFEAGSFELCREALAQLVEVLAYLGEQGVVHRDLKPENLMVDEDGRLRVIDFGLGKGGPADEQLTMTGQLVGTPAYMAPEQVRGEAVGPATDAFACAVMLYEWVAGRRPFGGDDAGRILAAVARGDFASLGQVNPYVDDELSRRVDALLDSPPDARRLDAAALAALLRAVAPEAVLGQTFLPEGGRQSAMAATQEARSSAVRDAAAASRGRVTRSMAAGALRAPASSSVSSSPSPSRSPSPLRRFFLVVAALTGLVLLLGTIRFLLLSPSSSPPATALPSPSASSHGAPSFDAARRFEAGLDALDGRENAMAVLAFSEVVRRGEEPWKSRARIRLWRIDEASMTAAEGTEIPLEHLKSAELGTLAWRLAEGDDGGLDAPRVRAYRAALRDGRALDLLRHWAGAGAALRVCRMLESRWLAQAAPRDEALRDLLLGAYRRLAELPLEGEKREGLVAVKEAAMDRIIRGLAWNDNRLPISIHAFPRWIEANLPPDAPKRQHLVGSVHSLLGRRAAFGGENPGE